MGKALGQAWVQVLEKALGQAWVMGKVTGKVTGKVMGKVTGKVTGKAEEKVWAWVAAIVREEAEGMGAWTVVMVGKVGVWMEEARGVEEETL